MRIAFITLGYRPFRTSGFDVSGERLVNSLLNAGKQVCVISGCRGPLVEEVHHPNLKIYRLPLGRADWIGFAYRAARFLETLGAFDVIHFWDVHFAYAYRGRYVASLHHSFHQRLSSLRFSLARSPIWLYRYTYYGLSQYLAEAPAAKRALGLLAVSATTRDEFLRHYDFSPQQVALARHGIDVDFFQPAPQPARQLRRRLHMGDDEPVIMFAGFITPRKGLEYLARALPQVQPVPRLLIAGRWRNAAYRRQVMGLLSAVKEYVVEVGFVPDEQLPAYYSLCDVYVSASLMEGFGLPLAEALACGTPVVAVDTGAVAEVIGPGGVLVPERDPNALAQAISALLHDTSGRRALGKRGREHIQQQFSLPVMLHSTLEAYERFYR